MWVLASILALCSPSKATPMERHATYQAVWDTCKRAGASDKVCLALLAVTWRESRGVATAVHTTGPGELGFGPHGLSWKYYRKLIEGATPDDFCDPELSTLAVLSLWQRFWRRGARVFVQLQRGFAGRRFGDTSRPEGDRRWCALLSRRGVDCRDEVHLHDLGVPIIPGTIRTTRELLRKP